MRELESEFWRIVEDGDEAVDVLTGMDLDSTEYGSGFPTGQEPLDGVYAAHTAAACTGSAARCDAGRGNDCPAAAHAGCCHVCAP